MSHSLSSLEPQTQSQSSNNQIIDQEEKRDNKEDEESASSSPNRNNHPLANSSPLLTQNLDEFNDINNNRRDAKNSNGIENISSKFETSEESDNKKNDDEKTSRGEIELVVENENENDNEDDYDVERCNNEEQSTVSYKLRASLATDADNDWIRAPKFFDEEQISQLTNEQIKTTLDYFILSGYRVSQMTKTYYDIEAVTKLLDEKEKDLELAATIGKQLLEKDQQLEVKIEYLELELEKTTEMVNQLRYEITLKDNLLKSFIDSEADGLWDEQNEIAQKKKLNEINAETLSEYKRKISHLESENEMLRTRAEFFEHETSDLESKESYLLENCVKELENSQSVLRDTQEELSVKTAECQTQQEEINNLFSQIFELQVKIKTLSQTNSDLKSNHETSTSEIINELNELKQKYNECLKQLNKTEEELVSLRKKTNTTPTPQTSAAAAQQMHNRQTSTSQILASMKSLSTQQTSCEDEESSFADMIESNAAISTRMTAANSNSFATELFCSLARDYRAKNLHTQASQSSDFVRKVKAKLVRQIPGSSHLNNDQLQSDSEAELFNCSVNNTREMLDQIENITGNSSAKTSSQRPHQNHHLHYQYQASAKFTNCPTPDSVLSTGSASIYSSLLKSSSSGGGFVLPERLQIVKPIEGSQTLQHWQYLATPNLGCLFEERPGVRVVKGTSPHDLFNSSIKKQPGNEPNPNETDEGLYEFTEFDDFCATDQFEDDDEVIEDDEDAEVDEYFRRSCSSATATQYEHQSIYNQRLEPPKNNSNRRVLSPSKVEMLTRLLEREEQQQQQQQSEHESQHHESENDLRPGIFGFIKRYFSSSGAETKETNEPSKTTNRRHRNECDDPDTPPSSPVNLPSNNILIDVFNSARSYFQPAKTAPTPPATPTHEIEQKSIYSFFDQIVNRLGSSFSTSSNAVAKTTPLPSSSSSSTADNSSSNKQRMTEKSFVDFSLDEEDFHQEEKELVDLEMQKELKTRLCSTPPPSPSKFSPPLPELNDQNDAYNEEQMKKSAFVKVASLNPYLNLSNANLISNSNSNSTTNTVDLASLLGSLGSLKRSQRF